MLSCWILFRIWTAKRNISYISISQREFGDTCRGNLLHLYKSEEVYWKQRAKIKWVMKGDGNTSFFYKFANLRSKINWISSVEWNGSEFSSLADFKRVFTEYFKETFDEPSAPQIDFDWEHLYPSSSVFGWLMLASLEGVKEAMFSLKGDKSPGSDGFSICFY